MSLDHENDVHHVLLHLDITHTLQQEDKMIHTEEEQFRSSVYTYPVFKNKTGEEGSCCLKQEAQLGAL